MGGFGPDRVDSPHEPGRNPVRRQPPDSLALDPWGKAGTHSTARAVIGKCSRLSVVSRLELEHRHAGARASRASPESILNAAKIAAIVLHIAPWAYCAMVDSRRG